MDQALDPEAYIFEGFWRDLSKSPTKSLTLTLCPTYAVILTNALALFVAMAGGQLWTIIRFSLHQIRAICRPGSTSKTHNQQQVVLRNATTDIATARLMLYLAWSCRRNAKGAMATCITILFLALFNAVFFMVAGTFSNTLVNAGTAVLSISPFCGVWNMTYFNIAGFGPNPTDLNTLSLSTEFVVKDWEEVQLNLEYARSCYSNMTSSYWDPTCGTFVKPRLNWTTDLTEPCPFGEEVCNQDTNVISFDTGPIDSHYDLGINAPPQDRITYRRVTQCTVLNDTMFTTTFTNNKVIGSDLEYKVAYANYGESAFFSTNETYSYSNFADFYTRYSGEGTTPFQIGTAYAFGPVTNQEIASTSTFSPIPQLVVKDADVGLLFLSFTGRYTEPIDDPWFSAHVVRTDPTGPSIVQKLYTPDRQISTIGCAERHQFCTGTGECSLLSGADQVNEYTQQYMTLSPAQNVTIDRVYQAFTRSSLAYIVNEIAKTSSPVLAINNSATGSFTVSLRLPNYQWQLELDRWHSIAMARMQRTVVEYATGQIAPQTKYLLPPQTQSEKWLCSNQRINSTVFQSFDVAALIVIILFGTLIIVVSLNVERLATWAQRRWHIDGRGRDMWNDHDMLGKQRWRAMFDTPQQSMYGNSPVINIQSPNRNMELAYLQTNFPGFGQSMRTSPSPQRSSQALSVGDSARTFPINGEKRSPPISSHSPFQQSPLRSAFTADFLFDFGPQGPPPHAGDTHFSANEKPLPQAPPDEKNFIIERGMESMSGPDGREPKIINQINSPIVSVPEPAVGSGPGRWAYYSAHKRRYGPRLAVPAPHAMSSNLNAPQPATIAPHISTRGTVGFKGDFDSVMEGNWI